eukprot:GFUD01040624.1.p1 GENE.GFUD01040624.1~~GFUD01040624.1.p1  ORF type:complete len:278 (-),score=76.25 GFUD01040624.1:51-884(-)
MDNNDVMDDPVDAKKYLEEVMGIVEDEEFNRERRVKMAELQKRDFDEEDFNYASADSWCCTKLFFFLILAVFLTSSILVMSNYKEDDSLGLRKMIQQDSLGLARLGVIFDSDRISQGFKLKELNNLPGLILNGFSTLISEMKPVMSKLWYFFEQKWLTPSVRVYKENFPFLKPGEKVNQVPNKEAPGEKPRQDKPKQFMNKKEEKVASSDVKPEHVHNEDEKIKDFKRMQEERRISSKDIQKEEKITMNEEVPPKKQDKGNPKKLKEDFGSFVQNDL